MGSIGAISAFGSQAVQQRLQQSKIAKPLTALEHAKKIRLGPVGKTEQELHLEKALEMAKNGNVQESLHAKVTREALEDPEKGNLHLALIKKKAEQPYDPMDVLANPLAQAGPAKQKTNLDGMNADELGKGVADRNVKVAEANARAAIENAKRFGAMFDSGSAENMSKNFFSGGKDVSGYDPNGHALKQASSPVGGVLNVMA